MKKNLYIFAALLLLSGCLNRELKPASAAPSNSAATVTIDGRIYNISGHITLSEGIFVDPADTVVIVPPINARPFSLGINTHPWIKPELLGDIKFHRYYLSSYYAWVGFGGKIKPQPMKQGGTPQAWGLDDILLNEKRLGNETLFTIHQTPDFVTPSGRGDGGGDLPPIKPGSSRTDTNSYREYALFLRQIVMRYGSVKYPDRLLNVDTIARWTGDKNELKSGLNLLKYIQFNNEEKIWKQGTGEYWTPEEMAAEMSICYDMIKATDPNMVVVSPCLSNAYMPYFEALDSWFKKNRKKKDWPCDIISCNYYLNTGNADGQFLGQWNLGGGCLPVQDKGFFRVKQLADFCAARGKRLWITETGFDDETADQSAMMIRGGETVRANAMIETANAMFAAGVERVIYFTAADEYNAGKTLYQRSGLMQGQQTGYKQKAAFEPVNNYAKSLTVKAQQQPRIVEDRTKHFTIPPSK